MKYVLAGLLLSASAALAHHAFAAEFDANKPVVLEGTLAKVEWVNPHSWIYVDVTEKDGKVVHWAVEFGSPNALLRRGLRRSDFPAGTRVTVKGFMAKDGSPTANASAVTLSDGRSLFTGTSNQNAEGAER